MEAACDRDPTGLIYRMPVGMTKIDLHSFYKIVHPDGIEKSEFYNILEKKFQNLVFSKVSAGNMYTHIYFKIYEKFESWRRFRNIITSYNKFLFPNLIQIMAS